jgi:hypothetical protein
MLTIKAVVLARDEQLTRDTPVPVKHFTLLTCEHIVVRRWRGNSSTPRNEPSYEVELHDVANGKFETLLVGPALDHYQTVYVLNEKGRTVETIHALE